MAQVDRCKIQDMVERAVSNTKITDIHTHIYAPEFGSLLLFGMDELLTFHYLVSETMRWVDMPYEQFWGMAKREQADLVWKTLFIDHSPISEAARGVLTMLDALGMDTSSRNLDDYRAPLSKQSPSDYVDRIFELTNIESAVMTNDPFDDLERPTWLAGKGSHPKFHAVLRIDFLLNSWDAARTRLREWGYSVGETTDASTCAEVRRFLTDWIDRMDALYMAASLPPTFAFPEHSDRGRLIQECVLPVAQSKNIPFAPMIGVKKLVNPDLKLAGDSVGKGDICAIEYLCSHYPNVKFLVTMLSRENQHELCVAARKFRNLMIFGCWWFLNTPSVIEEMTRMRIELLGTSFIPQHSDARVLEQVVYKWTHSRAIIGNVLTDKYADLAQTGWEIKEDEIIRDAADLLGGNFWRFLGRQETRIESDDVSSS
ncbi:MAG: glucuronate isomerase [Armatimonadota bacterium]